MAAMAYGEYKTLALAGLCPMFCLWVGRVEGIFESSDLGVLERLPSRPISTMLRYRSFGVSLNFSMPAAGLVPLRLAPLGRPRIYCS